MNKNNILPSLVCGFGAAVLTTVPGFKGGITCCLLVPIASLLSLLLHKKMNNPELPLKAGTGALLGLMTGLFLALFSTFFETIITFITHTNEFVETLPQTEAAMKEFNLGPIANEVTGTLRQLAKEIRNNGFSLFYTFAMLFGNVFIDSVVGLLGGLLGLIFANRRTPEK